MGYALLCCLKEVPESYVRVLSLLTVQEMSIQNNAHYRVQISFSFNLYLCQRGREKRGVFKQTEMQIQA